VREWFTPAEIAAELRVTRATVYALIRDRQIRATRVGLSLRVRVEDLAAYLSR
jgi:excisionase family DNA binding protein